MLHKSIVALLLLVSLLFAQLLAVQHQGEHIADLVSHSKSDDAHPTESQCDKCLSQSELGNGLALHHLTLAIDIASFVASFASNMGVNTRVLISFTARAPPQLS